MTTKEKALVSTAAIVLAILVIIMTCFHAMGGENEFDCLIYFLAGSLFGVGCGVILSILRSEQ